MTVGYSMRQIALHWIVFALVAFQFVTGDNMSHLFRATHGGRPASIDPVWTPVHIAAGVAILAAMVWRLLLRRGHGAPAPPKQHPALMRLASAVHVGLYLDLAGAALVGLIAYFWLPQLGALHELMVRQVLVVLFALHVAGALWHALVARDGVLKRMIVPSP